MVRHVDAFFNALKPCYLAVMLQVSSQDAAERHRRYWTMTVKMPDSITAEEFIDRVIWANDAIPYLPCLKNQADSPTEWPTMNEPFSDIELCMNVLNTLPSALHAAYWASKGTHFPVNLQKLMEDLKYLEIQVDRNKKGLEDLRRQLGNPVPRSGANKGNQNPQTGSGMRIPKKAARTATAAANKGTHFPVNLQKLMEDLKYLEIQVDRNNWKRC